jgi:hypothetical protein
MTCESWKELLNIDDSEEFIVKCDLDLPNQRVIQADVERTRVGTLTVQEKADLEMLLTFYCKEQGILYKQGMNEIMAPFLLIARNNRKLHSVYLFFKQFVHVTLGSMFADHEFRPLQAMFLIFRLLLRYHEPRMSNFMQINQVSPECYLTSWLLTVFSSKINDLDALFSLWKSLLEEQDQFFSLFLSLGLLLHFKAEFVSSSDIPYKLTSLQITDIETSSSILQKAKKLKSQMPYSSLFLLSKYNIYDLNNIDTLIIDLEQLLCVPVLPREIICRSFPESKFCSCSKNQCLWCEDHGKAVPLMIIDCRTKDKQEQGMIPNSVLLNAEAYSNPDEWLEFPDQFVSMRGVYHFCLLTSFEVKGGDFSFKVVEGRKTDIEDNMILNLLQVFLMKGFPFLSVVQGGFLKVHDLVKLFDQQLENHKENSCFLCDPNSKVTRNSKSNSAGDIEKAEFFRSFEGKTNPQVEEKEMKGSVIFFCQIEIEHRFLDCCLKISEDWFQAIPSENSEESIKASVSLLSNITILKKNPLNVSFSFQDNVNPVLLLMKSREEVKKCVGHVSTFFQKSLEKKEPEKSCK